MNLHTIEDVVVVLTLNDNCKSKNNGTGMYKHIFTKIAIKKNINCFF